MEPIVLLTAWLFATLETDFVCVDGKHYFDTFIEDALSESRYHSPGWPLTIRGRGNLMAGLTAYGKTIMLHSGKPLVVRRTRDSRVVILEYEVHGTILSSGAPNDNRFISVITIENTKIIHWRDCMDSLAAWKALNSRSNRLRQIAQWAVRTKTRF